MEGIIASIAQFDNDVRSERTVAGMKARLEQGGWTFPPALGYMKSRDSKNGKTIVPDPKRAPFVTRAFEMYATGLHSKQQVLDALTRLGLTTKSGKCLSPQSFDQLLRKPIYAGVLEVPGWGVRQPSNAPALVNRKNLRQGSSLAGRQAAHSYPTNAQSSGLPVAALRTVRALRPPADRKLVQRPNRTLRRSPLPESFLQGRQRSSPDFGRALC